MRLVKGELQYVSIDLYLALEFCNSGDLYSLRGHLTSTEVADVMWQLLTTVHFLHSNHIWHRDLKSANVLIHMINGARIVKIADLGSARSADADEVAAAAAPQGAPSL